MRSYIWKKKFLFDASSYDINIFPEFYSKRIILLPSVRSYLRKSLKFNTSWWIQTIFVLTISFFRFGLFMNTGWMSILAKTFWKRRLLMNLAFSILKISLISFLKGSRLPGKTRLSLPSSWKNKCIHNNNTHTVRCDENCVRTNKQCNQPYQH